MKNSKILLLVEGEKREKDLMEHLLDLYGISDTHQIIPYKANIYMLYDDLFDGGDPADFDLLQHLKSREADPNNKWLFDENYSDIVLIFDFEPHDSRYSDDKIKEMASYFTESSDMGKLYINYPMVEAFYHMKSIPDENYDSYMFSLSELEGKTYRNIVGDVNKHHIKQYNRYPTSRSDSDIIISQNICKAWRIVGGMAQPKPPDLGRVLEKQIDSLNKSGNIYVLCTCAFYISDYNPALIDFRDI
jgi:hypothetical protein